MCIRDSVEVAREQGLGGFIRGLSPTLLRAIPAAAATFTTFEVAKDALDRAD